MEKTSIEGIETSDADIAIGRRRLSDALGTTEAAINHYRLDPGEGLPGGLHAHFDQEEVFVVLDGEATFETLDGEITVKTGEAIRVAPGEYQTGRNVGDDEVELLALGAPMDTDDVRLPFSCPDCGHEDLRLDLTDGVFVCPDCDAEHVPAPCPDCGGETLEGTLGDDETPVVACRDCGAAFESPPLA